MPLNYPSSDTETIVPLSLDLVIQSLADSTAGGGIQAGGGVRKLWLGCSYPLIRLFNVAPNLEHLHLVDIDLSICLSTRMDSPEDTEVPPFP